MAARNLFVADTPLALLAAAGVARHQGMRAHLVLSGDFEQAGRLARLLQRWRDNPFEAVTLLPGAQEVLRRAPGLQHGLAAFARRSAALREVRRETLATLMELDARFQPDAVWVGNDRPMAAQYALHLAGQRSGTRPGRFLDPGLVSYLGRGEQALAQRVDELVTRLRHGRWARRVRQAGTSPWIAQSWLAFPAEAQDQAPGRERLPLPREWFGGRDFLRLATLAAREFQLRRAELRGCSVVLLLPPSRQLRGDATRSLRLQRLLESAQACGRRVALQAHALDREAVDAKLLVAGASMALPAALPPEWLPALLPRGTLLAGAASSALLAARWLRPDLVVCELEGVGEQSTGHARALLARHGIEPLDETALSARG